MESKMVFLKDVVYKKRTEGKRETRVRTMSRSFGYKLSRHNVVIVVKVGTRSETKN